MYATIGTGETHLDNLLLGVETALPAEPPVCSGVDEADMAMDAGEWKVMRSVRDVWLSCAEEMDAAWRGR